MKKIRKRRGLRKGVREAVSTGVIAILMISVLATVAVPSLFGDDVVLPTAFYGNVTVNGEPAPEDTVITGKIVNAVGSPGEGNITVTEAGKYGGSGGFDPKLSVTTDNENDIGKTIEFYIKLPSGAEGKANETSTFVSFSDPRELDLTATIEVEAPPNITSWSPEETNITNYVGESRTFSITVNQTVNVSWQINGTEVQFNESVTEASYTNTSAVVGTWNVSAIVSNANGTDMQTWWWTVKDVTAPTYEWIKRPTEGTTGESVLVNVSATDNVGVTLYNITVDGVEHAMTKNGDYYTFTINIPLTSTASIVYNCTFGDAAGNTNTTPDTTITVTDNDEPTIVSVTLDRYAVNPGETINVTVNATDNIGVVNVTADGASLSLDGGLWKGAITAPAAAGTYNVSVIARDEANNTATNDTVQYEVILPPEVVINEIMYNPVGGDTGHEWIEIYNNGTESVNLTGWKLYEDTANHGLTLEQGSMLILTGGYAIIADNATQFLIDHPGYTGTVIDSVFSLSNTGEYIALKDASLNIVDGVTYNASWGADENSRTLEVNKAGEWKESRVDGGTPGEVNSVCYPTVTVLYPNGGETFTIGTSVEVSAKSSSPSTKITF